MKPITAGKLTHGENMLLILLEGYLKKTSTAKETDKKAYQI